MPGDDEYFHEYHSHVYGPVGIFLMDIRGHRITEDGIQKSDNPMICEAQWDAFGKYFPLTLKSHSKNILKIKLNQEISFLMVGELF